MGTAYLKHGNSLGSAWIFALLCPPGNSQPNAFFPPALSYPETVQMPASAPMPAASAIFRFYEPGIRRHCTWPVQKNCEGPSPHSGL